MIKIDGMKIEIAGSGNDLFRDTRTFIELFTNNESISKIAFGEGYENVSKFFNIDCLLRIIFTICSVNEAEFNRLLDSIIEITDDCKNEKFKLIFKERK